MDGAVAAFPTKDWETPKWTWRVWLRCWDAPMMRAEGWETSEIFPKSSEIRQGRSKDFIMFAFEAFVHSLHFCDFLCGTWHWVRFLYHFVTFGTSEVFYPAEAHCFSPRVADFILIWLYFSGSDPSGGNRSGFFAGSIEGFCQVWQLVAAQRWLLWYNVVKQQDSPSGNFTINDIKGW